MDRKASSPGQRLRIARSVDEEFLRWLAGAVRPGGVARIELRLANGRRMRIARGGDESDLRALLQAVGFDSNAHVELVFDGN